VSDAIELVECSLPDRDHVVCELWQSNEQLAEIGITPDGLKAELFGRRDGDTWNVELEDLLASLLEAKTRLSSINTNLVS
jgi:hypothetical protein